MSSLSRRSLLRGVTAAGLLAGTGVLAACQLTHTSSEEVKDPKTIALLRRLVAEEYATIHAYQGPGLRDVSDEDRRALIRVHTEHAEALIKRLPDGEPTPQPSSEASESSSLSVEEAAMRRFVDGCGDAASDVGDLADLLTSVAASEYAHLTAVGGEAPQRAEVLPELTAASVAVAQEVLKALHGVVYLYPVFSVHMSDTDEQYARTRLHVLRHQRDLLASRIAEKKIPAAAQPTYPFQQDVADHASARRAAAHIETVLAAAWRQLASATQHEQREEFTLRTADAAVVSAHWKRANGQRSTDTLALGAPAFV